MGNDPFEAPAADLCSLLDISLETLTDLTERGILVEGSTPGSYRLEPNVKQYCQYLRESSHGRGEAAAAGQTPQADRSDALMTKLRGEPVPVADIETRRRTRLRLPNQLFGRTIGSGIRSFRIYIRHGRSYTVYDI